MILTTPRLFLYAAFVALLVTAIPTSLGQSPGSDAAELPEAIAAELNNALSSEDRGTFVSKVRSLLNGHEAGLARLQRQALRQAVYERAKQWLQQGELAALSIDDAKLLIGWGGQAMTPAERDQFAQILARESPPAANATFDQMNRHLVLARAVPKPSIESVSQQRQYAADWLASQQLSSLSDGQLDAVVDYIAPSFPAGSVLEVEWTGRIIPPREGQYVFSISPLQISNTRGRIFHRQTVTVEVGDQLLIDAQPNNWSQSSPPQVLKGSETIPIRVVLTYAHNDPLGSRLATMQLYWEGPGIAKSIVPSSALRMPSENMPGVAATGRWTRRTRTGEVSEVVVDSQQVANIDRVFLRSSLCSYETLLRSCVEERLVRLTSAEAFSSLPSSQSNDGLHPLFAPNSRHLILLKHCSSTARQQCAQALLEHPESYAQATPAAANAVYRSLRPGAEREAVDVLGAWLMANANIEPLFRGSRDDFYNANRRSFRDATANLVFEHRDAIKWIEEDYSETESGECVLPTAYLLVCDR